MNRRVVVSAAIIALSLLAVFVFGYRWFYSRPALTVHLRCGANTSGKLSVARIAQNGAPGAEKTFDLAAACQNGKIEIDGYQREEAVQFTLNGRDGEPRKVVSEYGQDIQSDRNGFYTVLKFTEQPPFIIKDSI